MASELSVIHVTDHGVAKPTRTNQGRAGNQPLQILFHILAASQLAP